jgi:hypothetical protein
MKRDEVPPGKHIAIPTYRNDTLHDGSYSHHCPICQATAVKLVTRDHRPEVNGHLIGVGSIVKLKPESRSSEGPAWVTITEVRLNTHTGQIWLAAFALGQNRVLVAADFSEVKW